MLKSNETNYFINVGQDLYLIWGRSIQHSRGGSDTMLKSNGPNSISKNFYVMRIIHGLYTHYSLLTLSNVGLYEIISNNHDVTSFKLSYYFLSNKIRFFFFFEEKNKILNNLTLCKFLDSWKLNFHNRMEGNKKDSIIIRFL